MSVSASAFPGIASFGAYGKWRLEAPGQATNELEGATYYAGIEINQNSLEYVIGPTSASTYLGRWAEWGFTGVYAEFIRTGGASWWGSSPGGSGTRHLCTTTRKWFISRSSVGTTSISGYFELYTEASGGTPVHTTDTATWSVTVESNL